MYTRFAMYLLTAVVVLAGCNSSPVESQTEPLKFTIAKSDLVERETDPVPENLLTEQVASNNRFAVNLYKKLIEDEKNCFISPYSITAALAMTAAGAANNTKDEMLEALQVTLPGTGFDQALNGIDQALTSHAENNDGITFSIVNSTWMQTGWGFNFGYLDHLSRYYDAGINILDFLSDPDACRTIINDWIADQTNDKILDLFPDGSIKSDTKAVLTNAVYFLGDWQTEFRTDLTEESYFYTLDHESADVPMMRLTESGGKVYMRYTRQHGVRALDYPYKGKRFAMTVILPDYDSFPTVEQSLSAGYFDTLFSSMEPESLEVTLPKFTLTYGTKDLAPSLKALGIIDAFSPGLADFSIMGGQQDLYISQVVHKAFIAVDEKGTEAAAATGVVMVPTSADNDMKIFIVNRPFIFVIRDTETGTIIFMGRVLNPLLQS